MIVDELRELLATITGRDELRHLDQDAPLFGGEVELDSLAGVRLLAAVLDRYGVDVAADDLNLDALANLAALATFIRDSPTNRE